MAQTVNTTSPEVNHTLVECPAPGCFQRRRMNGAPVCPKRPYSLVSNVPKDLKTNVFHKDTNNRSEETGTLITQDSPFLRRTPHFASLQEGAVLSDQGRSVVGSIVAWSLRITLVLKSLGMLDSRLYGRSGYSGACFILPR